MYERMAQQNRHGENTLDISQQQLFAADQRGKEKILLDWPFVVVEHGAVPVRTFFNFTGHRRRVAPQSIDDAGAGSTTSPH